MASLSDARSRTPPTPGRVCMPARASSEPAMSRLWRRIGIIASVGGLFLGAGLSSPLLPPAPAEPSSPSRAQALAASIGTPMTGHLQVPRRSFSPILDPSQRARSPREMTHLAARHSAPAPWTQMLGPALTGTEGPWYGEGRHPMDKEPHNSDEGPVTPPNSQLLLP